MHVVNVSILRHQQMQTHFKTRAHFLWRQLFYFFNSIEFIIQNIEFIIHKNRRDLSKCAEAAKNCPFILPVFKF